VAGKRTSPKGGEGQSERAIDSGADKKKMGVIPEGILKFSRAAAWPMGSLTMHP